MTGFPSAISRYLVPNDLSFITPATETNTVSIRYIAVLGSQRRGIVMDARELYSFHPL